VHTFPSAEELARTDVLVIHRQAGGDFKPDEKIRVEKFAARGGSFVVIHAGAVAGNDASANFYKDLVGGSWRQKVTKWREGPMELNFVNKQHGITQGIADFGMKDEIYYDMDMRPDVHALATALTPKKGEMRKVLVSRKIKRNKVVEEKFEMRPTVKFLKIPIKGAKGKFAFRRQVITPGARARPFMKPAFDAKQEAAVDAFVAAVKREVARL
jgi:hypothetical protein